MLIKIISVVIDNGRINNQNLGAFYLKTLYLCEANFHLIAREARFIGRLCGYSWGGYVESRDPSSNSVSSAIPSALGDVSPSPMRNRA